MVAIGLVAICAKLASKGSILQQKYESLVCVSRVDDILAKKDYNSS